VKGEGRCQGTGFLRSIGSPTTHLALCGRDSLCHTYSSASGSVCILTVTVHVSAFSAKDKLVG